MKLTVKLPDFSLTRGQIPSEGRRGRPLNIRRSLSRVAGWGALGMVFFLLFAWIALPTKAVAWRIGHEARKAGYNIAVDDVTVWPWGSVTLHNVVWTFEPSRPDTAPHQYTLEEVDISIGMMALMTGDLDIEVESLRDDGSLWAHYEQSGDDSKIELKVDGIMLYDIPKAPQSLGVPLMGLLSINVDLEIPEGKFVKSHGSASISCSGCSAGDGESKLYVPGSSALKDGLTIPEIELGSLNGKISVEKGVVKFEGPMEAESDDLKLSITGGLKLKDPFKKSRFNMVLKVELTEAFQLRSERVALMYRGASAKSRLDPPERGLGFRLEGPVSTARFRGIKSKSKRQRKADSVTKRRERKKARDAKRAASKAKKKKKSEDAKTKRDAKAAKAKQEADDKAKDDEAKRKDEKEDPPPPAPEPSTAEPTPEREPEAEAEEVVEILDPEPAPGEGGGDPPTEVEPER